MTNKTKYKLTTVAMVVLAYLVYRFYIYAQSSVYDDATLTGLVFIGIGLIIIIGVVSVLRKYYKIIQQDASLKYKETKAEIDAYSALAEDKLKDTKRK
ncbi:MAG TPA: hypothetical protein VFD55_00430 [Candidatus Angelobacter sp.]|nr:hypothetical protein [Candidatus Angelobacter sp.]